MEAHGWTTWWAPRPAARAEAWQDFTATFAWLLGLQLLDLLTTLGALSHGAVEANPAAVLLLESHGPAALVQLKVVSAVLMLGWLPAFRLVERPGTGRTTVAAFLGLLVVLAIFYSIVVVNNLAVLASQLGGA
jgi:hypothetical protein